MIDEKVLIEKIKKVRDDAKTMLFSDHRYLSYEGFEYIMNDLMLEVEILALSGSDGPEDRVCFELRE